MKKYLHIFIIFLCLLAGLACAPSLNRSQISFGVWAAEHQLWEEAVFRWTRALEENPNSVAALNNLAVAYEKQGRWEEADKAYQAALKIAPKNESIKSNYEKFKAASAEPKESHEKK